MRMNRSAQVIISFIKASMGNLAEIPSSPVVVSDDFTETAYQQCVAAICAEGLQKLLEAGVSVEYPDKLTLVSMTFQQEQTFLQQEQRMTELSELYRKHGYRMMVLKGWGLSRNYPVPQHRPSSDLDIYLFGKQQEADAMLEQEYGIEIDNGHHHHTVFNYKGLSVENHYDFINVHSHRSSKKIEARLKKLAEQEQDVVRLENGVEIIVPSAELDALFTLKHMAVEFAANGMMVRNILDWGLLVRAKHEQIDWKAFWAYAKEVNLHQFLYAVDRICIDSFAFEEARFHLEDYPADGMKPSLELFERVLNDCFVMTGKANRPKGVLRYVVSRYRNWRENEWKHRLVYPDSLLSTFLYQMMSHLMKPSTLKN